jgi:hypothetical protein
MPDRRGFARASSSRDEAACLASTVPPVLSSIISLRGRGLSHEPARISLRKIRCTDVGKSFASRSRRISIFGDHDDVSA